MWIQAIGITGIATSNMLVGYAMGSVLVGLGTAFVYPTLLAVIGDVAHPSWRASAVGVYRFWRDLGYAIGALLAGIIADVLGVSEAMVFVAVVTFASGLIVAIRQRETLPTTRAAGLVSAELDTRRSEAG
jgi:MFS family permease